MRQRVILGTKLCETLARGLFVLLCTYRLPIVEAGQFGVAVTVIGLSAFFLGYERQIDVQRQVAGRSSWAVRQRIGDTLRFFGIHYAISLPALSLLLWLGLGWSLEVVPLVVLVTVAEHLSNQSYQAVLVNRSNYPLQALASAKTVLLLAGVATLLLSKPSLFTFGNILLCWAVVSIAYLPLAAWVWSVWLKKEVFKSSDSVPPQSVTAQYRISLLHFLVGLVAVLALQADRYVVIGLLSAHEVGVFFRHVTLSALALQAFNIVSFNRIAPGVYASCRNGALKHSRDMVRIEFLRFSTVTIALFASALIVNGLAGSPLARLDMDPRFLTVLMLAVLLRSAADYAGLLLLSIGKDAIVFRNQLSAVVAGIAVLLMLTWMFGLPGVITGAAFSPSIYLLLNGLNVRRHF